MRQPVAIFIPALIFIFSSDLLAQTTWTEPVLIDTSTAELGWQVCLTMDVDRNGYIGASWTDASGGGGSFGSDYVLFERSTNAGLSWVRTVVDGGGLNNEGEGRCVRDVMFDSLGNVWVLWAYYPSVAQLPELRLSRSTDNGQNFETIFQVQEYTDFFRSQLATDADGNIYLLRDDTQLTLTRFRNGDPTNRLDSIVPTDTFSVGSDVSLVVSDSSFVYVFWEGSYYTPSGYREFVFCSVSNDTGATFCCQTRVDTNEVIIPPGFSFQGDPRGIVGSDGVLRIAYSKQVDDSTVKLILAKSENHGSTFAPQSEIAQQGVNTEPKLTLDPFGGLSVLWNSSSTSLTFSRSTDGGETFSQGVGIGVGRGEIGSGVNGDLYVTFEPLRIYFTKSSVISGLPPASRIPLDIYLSQNYPNPFNSSSLIEFEVPSAGSAVLDIYSLTGEEIEILVGGQVTAGTHQVRWEPKNLASGVYLCRLSFTSRLGLTLTTSRKLLLLR